MVVAGVVDSTKFVRKWSVGTGTGEDGVVSVVRVGEECH